MKLVNRLLPGPVGVEGDEIKSGKEAQREKKLPGWLMRLGRAERVQNNEV